MANEDFFTSRVMRQIRLMEPDIVVWHHFLQWAVPAIGLGVASLLLATRSVVPPPSALLETAISQHHTWNEDPFAYLLENHP